MFLSFFGLFLHAYIKLFQLLGFPQWERIHLSMQDTRFNLWSRKIPRAVEELTLCITTTEPTLQGPGVAPTDAYMPRAHAPQLEKPCSEKPMHCTQSSPRSLHLENSLRSNKDQHSPPPKDKCRKKEIVSITTAFQ